MKRLLSLLCAAALSLSLMGCGRAAASMSGASGGGSAGRTEPVPDNAGKSVALPDESTALSDKPAALPEEPVPLCQIPGGVQLADIASALAEYPDAVAQPNEDDYYLPDGSMDSETFSRDYESWRTYEAARPSVPESADRLADFFRDAEGQFLSGGTENRAVSPVNIYFALCLIAEITGGESRAQVLHLLNADSIGDLRAQAVQTWNALYKDDGTSALLPAASLWMKDGFPFNEDTLNRLAEDYRASSFHVDTADPIYTAALQCWLTQQSRGLLEQQAGNVGLSPETVLAVASTLYFKSPWLSSFNDYHTKPDTFHGPDGDRTAPFMRQTVKRAKFYAGKGFTAFPLPMDAGEMWLILPDRGNTVDALLEAGAVADLLAAPEDYVSERDVNVSLSLPRFDVSGELDLIDGLKAMGVTKAFSDGVADFTPLTDAKNLFISKMQHAARVTVNEDGCEAAAFTVSMVELTSAMTEQPKVIEFKLDRPFLFVVAGERNLPLFTGVVNVPEAA